MYVFAPVGSETLPAILQPQAEGEEATSDRQCRGQNQGTEWGTTTATISCQSLTQHGTEQEQSWVPEAPQRDTETVF